MPKENAVRKVIIAAGGPMKLSRFYGVSYAAINTFERQGFLPLKRAQEALAEWPGVAELRDLVRPDLKNAMDMQHGISLLK